MKSYDLIKSLLEDYPQLRNSDKALQFTVWNKQGLVQDRAITYDNYKKALSSETIRRTRQKIQENHPELCPTSDKVKQFRRKKQDTKSTFIYRELI